jgi:hypothetical protein
VAAWSNWGVDIAGRGVDASNTLLSYAKRVRSENGTQCHPVSCGSLSNGVSDE